MASALKSPDNKPQRAEPSVSPRGGVITHILSRNLPRPLLLQSSGAPPTPTPSFPLSCGPPLHQERAPTPREPGEQDPGSSIWPTFGPFHLQLLPLGAQEHKRAESPSVNAQPPCLRLHVYGSHRGLSSLAAPGQSPPTVRLPSPTKQPACVSWRVSAQGGLCRGGRCPIVGGGVQRGSGNQA